MIPDSISAMDYISPYGDSHPDSPWYKEPEEEHYDPREDEDLYMERILLNQ